MKIIIGIVFTFIVLIALVGWLIFTLAILLEKGAIWLMGINRTGPVMNALYSNFTKYLDRPLGLR
jgi:hypothetical protein